MFLRVNFWAYGSTKVEPQLLLNTKGVVVNPLEGYRGLPWLHPGLYSVVNMKEKNFVSCFLEVNLKFDKNASLLKHQKIAYCEKLIEYNEVAIRYVAPLKVAPKLAARRDKHAQIT